VEFEKIRLARKTSKNVWDSRESYERFRDETLMPGLQALGDAGLPCRRARCFASSVDSRR